MSPQAIPAVIAGFASGSSIAGGIGFSWGAFTASAMLSAVSYAVNKQAMKNGDLGSSLSQTIKNPTSARRIIYGERRVSGTLLHIGSTNDDKYKHLVIALAGHEVESISDIYLNDNPLSYYNKFGNKPTADVDWDVSSGLSVIVNGTTYSGTMASIVSALETSGFIASGDAGNYEVKDGVFADSAHLEITVENVDDLLTVTSNNGTVRTNIGHEVPVIVRTHLGSPDQLADVDLVSQLPEWTTAHRLREIAYIYVRLRYEFSAFPSGIPNVTAVVKGKKDIYDPRTTLSSYTNNSALCTADYLASEKYGFGAGYGDEIDIPALIAAANVADEQVALVVGGTENRYTCNGVIDTSVDPKPNIESLLSSMAGTAVYTGGLWTIKAGAYEAPTLTLDESNCRAGITLQTKLSRTKICNGVKGVYTSPENEDQPADFPAITNATYLAEDNNERIWKDIDLPFTTSPGMAQRLAKIILEQTRQGMTLTYPCNLSALPLTAGDTVNINNTRFGWNNKPFRVAEWEFVVDADGKLGIDLTLRETASGIYDWNSGEETTVDLAPNTSLTSPWFVAPITAMTLTESTEVNSDGAIIPGLTVVFDPSASTIEFYRVELYLTRDDTLWTSQDTIAPGCVFKNLLGGKIYRVRVTAYNRFGAHSQSVIKNIGLIGLPGPPAAPSALIATPVSGGIRWNWINNTPEYALLGTEIYTSLTNDRATATLLNLALGNNYSHQYDTATTVFAWLRAIDKTANPSEWYPLSITSGVVATSELPAAGADGADGIDGINGTDGINGSSTYTYYQTVTPSGATINELWFNPSTGSLKRYSGSVWQEVSDRTVATLEAFTEITSGGLRMTNVVTGDFTQMTPGEYEVYRDGILYKAVNRVDAEESWSSGTPVVHSPPFRITPKVTLFAKETPSYLAAYSTSNHTIELVVENNSPAGFTPYNRLILHTGTDATQNFALSFASAAATKTTLNTAIDTVTITLDDVYENAAVYTEVHDGVWAWVSYNYSLNIQIRYRIGTGSWVTSYTGPAYKRGIYGAVFVHSITGINSGANNVTVEITNLGQHTLVSSGGEDNSDPSETVAEFVKMRELAEATQTVPGELGWLAIEAG
ncbi:MAG: phage tail protein [Desulfuromusa sp.]|nr:phage tail protein [Desulfuromusa sp.]